MVLSNDPAWLGTVLKVVLILVIGAVGLVIEHKTVDWMGHLRAWVGRVLTRRRHRTDPDSWLSVVLGWVTTIIGVMCVTGCFISHRQNLWGGN